MTATLSTQSADFKPNQLVTEEKYLAPVTCAPWCWDGTGHGREVFREDQHCASKIAMDDGLWVEGGTVEIAVFLARDPGEHPRVAIDIEPNDPARRGASARIASTAVARELAARILQQCDLLDGDGATA